MLLAPHKLKQPQNVFHAITSNLMLVTPFLKDMSSQP